MPPILFLAFLMYDVVVDFTSSTSCPVPHVDSEGWELYEGKWYKAYFFYYKSYSINWDQAEEYCRNQTGLDAESHLVSIHSEEEHKFIGHCLVPWYFQGYGVTVSVDFYWIGYRAVRDIYDNISSIWSDGSSVEYANRQFKLQDRNLRYNCGLGHTNDSRLHFTLCENDEENFVCQKQLNSHVYIKCIRNCWQDTMINPSESLALSFDKSRCSVCKPGHKYTYSWKLVTNEPMARSKISWKMETTTGNDKENLVIVKDVFPSSSSNTEYKLVLTAQMYDGSNKVSLGEGEYRFWVNAAPVGGHCFVDPTEGVPFLTQFAIKCPNYTDVHTPLSYLHRAVIDNEYVVLHYSHDWSSQVNIPVGRKENNFYVRIEVTISDSRGSSRMFPLRVKVQPDDGTMTRMEMLTAKDSLLSNLINKKQVNKALSLISEAAVLLNMKMETAIEETDIEVTKSSHLREVLLEHLVSTPVQFNVTNLEMSASVLNQVTSGLKRSTNERSENLASLQTTKLSVVLDVVAFSEKSAEPLHDASVQIMQSVSNVMRFIGFQYKKKETETAKMNATDSEHFDEYTERTQQRMTDLIKAIDRVKGVIANISVPFEKTSTIVCDTFTVSVEKARREDVACSSDSYISLPCTLLVPAEESFTIETINFYENPYFWVDTNITSNVYTIDAMAKNRSKLMQFHDLPDPITIKLVQHNTLDFQNITITKETTVYVTMNTSIDIGNAFPYIAVRFAQNITSVPLEMYVHSSEDVINGSITEDGWLNEVLLNDTVPLQNTGVPGTYDAILPNGQQFYLVMLKLNSSHYDSLSLEFMTSWLRCLYWDSKNWSTQGCQPRSVHLLSVLVCECNHLSTFGSSLIVAPNTVNYADATQFLTFWRNPIGVIVVVLLFVLYVLAIIWARRKDTQRSKSRKAVDFADNDPRHMYRYIILLETGTKTSEPPSSHAGMMLEGSQGTSEPHSLRHSGHLLFQPGAINFFVLCTDETLGEIHTIRLWHDSQGDYPHWFVRMCLVYDPQENKKWTFQCKSWLSPERGEQVTSKVFEVVDRELSLTNMLYSNAMHDMRHNHLYLSIFMSSRETNFTLCQRLGCCFCILMLGMLTNIMFFGVEKESKYDLKWGKITFPMENLMISVESALIMLAAAMIVSKLFQLCKPRYPIYIIKESYNDDSPSKLADNSRSLSADFLQHSPDKIKHSAGKKGSLARLSSMMSKESISHWYKAKRDAYNEMSDTTLPKAVSIAKPQRGLPWWCVYIVWLLVMVTTGVCSFYIILYTFNFGFEKSVAWIASVTVTQVIDILALDPLKIILLATLACCIFRRYYIEDLDEMYQITDEEPIENELGITASATDVTMEDRRNLDTIGESLGSPQSQDSDDDQ